MEKSEIQDKLTEVLVDELGLDKDKINGDASFEEDLEVDSLGVVELLMALEDNFGVSIPDEEAGRHLAATPDSNSSISPRSPSMSARAPSGQGRLLPPCPKGRSQTTGTPSGRRISSSTWRAGGSG